MKDAHGTVLGTVTKQGNNFASLGDETLSCEESVGGWQDGYFNIRLESAYDVSQGDIEVRITNTLDQGAGDESIGFGEMRLVYKFDPNVEWVPALVGDYDDDEGNENPITEWQNNCGASQKTCQGEEYIGGHNQCAQGHQFWRVYHLIQPQYAGVTSFTVEGRVWTIDSWDGEQFTV